METPTTRGCWVALCVAVCLCAEASGAQRWWNLRWLYRREVTVRKVQQTGLPGDDVAWAQVYTGGQAAADGSDIRVVDSRNRETASRVLAVGPGDRVAVVFAVVPGIEHYWVYFGNAKAPGKAQALRLRRGILHEVWNAQGKADTAAEADTLIARTGPPAGTMLRDRMFVGHNPFGPGHRIACRLTGYFVAPQAGRYEFVATGRGGTFLSIDGKGVDSRGGRQAPRRRFDRGAKVTLTAGLHRMTVRYVCTGGDPIVMAAWRPPGTDRFEIVPTGAFAPVAAARSGAMARYPGTGDVDFRIEHLGEAFVSGRYFQRFRFTAEAVGDVSPRQRWRWDLGDGQTTIGAVVEHVFLGDGAYAVTLSGVGPRGHLSRTNRIATGRDWDRATRRRIDAPVTCGKIVAGYDFGALSAEDAAEAVVLLAAAGQTNAMLKAGDAVFARPSPSDRAMGVAAWVYIDALAARGRDREAVSALLKVSRGSDSPALELAMCARAAGLMIERLGDIDGADTLLTAVMAKHAKLSGSAVYRQAALAASDVLRARGQAEAAREAYAGLQAHRDARAVVLLRGDRAVKTEDFLRRKELQAAEHSLQRWQDALPTDKLEGYWSLLRARLLAARGFHGAAAREAQTLVAVNPKSNYAPDLLMLAGEAYDALGDGPRGVAAWKRIVDEYPESSLATRAADVLKRQRTGKGGHGDKDH